jgi:hypothetical protein
MSAHAFRRAFVVILSLSPLTVALAQQPAGAFREPPAVITQLVTAPPPPSVELSPQAGWLVSTTDEALPGVDVVGRPHLKLAGMRIDTRTWSRQLGT